MRCAHYLFLFHILCSFLLVASGVVAQENQPDQIIFNDKQFPCYPQTLDSVPDIPSPLITDDGTEIVLTITKDGRCALIPVTVENGKPLHYSRRVKSVLGKDQQLLVDSGDFPTLARTGLHSDQELEAREMITGFPVSLITYIGRPGRFSGAGFMADDEDIISVLKNDNHLVRGMGLTHPQMAKPLFHVWNVILKEIELGNWGRYWDNIQYLLYNNRKIMLKANGTKGWQISIFQDEIQGSFDFDARVELTAAEKDSLKLQNSHLSAQQLAALEEILCHIHFSEMAAYYIMRYGFYEGHTTYRTDPIAIAVIFGLKKLDEIEGLFHPDLYYILTNHFTSEKALK